MKFKNKIKILLVLVFLLTGIVAACNGNQQNAQVSVSNSQSGETKKPSASTPLATSTNPDKLKLGEGIIRVERYLTDQFSNSVITGTVNFSIQEEINSGGANVDEDEDFLPEPSVQLPPKVTGTGEGKWLYHFQNQVCTMSGEWKLKLSINGEIRNHAISNQDCKMVANIEEVTDEVLSFNTDCNVADPFADPSKLSWHQIFGPITLDLIINAHFSENAQSMDLGDQQNSNDKWILQELTSPGLVCFIPQETATP